MSTFSAITTAGSSLYVHRKWMDAVSDNIANINTATSPDEPAFRERFIQAQAVEYGTGQGGVRVAGAQLGSAEGLLVYEPENPLADEAGYVRKPDIDLGEQMTYLLMSQRGYQANLAVVERATTSYEAALRLGKG
ncbi:flagellar basal-body rod protein FlgC [Modestobacter sp. I12A-02628]|uniref:Flagellar basal-body rod protein FlgC n=1 Tax=Goekera deserti TaxID=2497753 RepID=A0A7K3WII6_9ACTN|nr:flagellar basal body rod C-terminal domain-containing protein [Goekera deserti]MPQ99503.1 flagellar basal-body rod protein FlgC [Goekera deserti]NDI48990.1 flagellar basal-body rod protein FlgC [Goekera deserti]NEL55540.1 flagellar basal-body rod protein FlgC [Goekera deserti]